MQESWRRHPLHGHWLRIFAAVIEGAWCRETASPACQDMWHELNPSWGQCAVTVLLLEQELRQELDVACEILRAEVPGCGSHYWVRLPDGTEVDLTRGQFPPETAIAIPPGEIRSRASLLEGERAEAARTRERFELLERTCQEIWLETVGGPMLGAVAAINGSVADEARKTVDRLTPADTKTPT